jgi:hypothetical protein
MGPMKALLACLFVLFSLSRPVYSAESKVYIPRGSYVLSLAPHGKNMDQAMPFVAQVLNSGGRLLLALPKDVDKLLGDSGLEKEAARALLSSQGPYYFLQQDRALIEAAKIMFPKVKLDTLNDDKGPQLVLLSKGLPRTAVIEEAASSISPLSVGLRKQFWPYTSLGFDKIEASPGGWMDARRYDFVSLSSPGWWYNFAGPPSGPSRMGTAVSYALRNYVSSGGTAYFCDLAQWDLEKAWPGSINLDSLGPTKSRLFNLGDSDKSVALYMAMVGTAVTKLKPPDAFVLLSAPKYAFPEGKPRQAIAAYGFRDPSNGAGLIYGQGFHSFDQDDDAGGVAVRNLLMDLMVISGRRRLSAWDGVGQPVKAQSPVPTSLPTFNPPPTMIPGKKTPWVPIMPLTAVTKDTSTFTPTPTDTFTSVPTVKPTLKPTKAVPTATPTDVPTPVPPPTAVPDIPTPVPAKTYPTAKPTVETSKTKANKVLGCLQASPQPFSDGGVFIYFCLKQKAWVRLTIFDLKGHLIRTVKKSEEPSGNRQWFYDGKDERGNLLNKGTYYYSLDAWGDGIKDQSFDKIQKE